MWNVLNLFRVLVVDEFNIGPPSYASFENPRLVVHEAAKTARLCAS